MYANHRKFLRLKGNRGRGTRWWRQILDQIWKYGRFAHAQWKIYNITLICGGIAEIFACCRKSGSSNTILTSDLRAEVEIWPFRACAMHPAIIIGTVRSLWTWLWGIYHVPQNVFLVHKSNWTFPNPCRLIEQSTLSQFMKIDWTYLSVIPWYTVTAPTQTQLRKCWGIFVLEWSMVSPKLYFYNEFTEPVTEIDLVEGTVKNIKSGLMHL